MPVSIKYLPKLFFLIWASLLSFCSHAQKDLLTDLFELKTEQEINRYFETHFKVSEKDSLKISHYFSYENPSVYIDTLNHRSKSALTNLVKVLQKYKIQAQHLIYEEAEYRNIKGTVLSLKRLYKKDSMDLSIKIWMDIDINQNWRSSTPLEFNSSPLSKKVAGLSYITSNIDTLGYSAYMQHLQDIIATENKMAFMNEIFTRDDLEKIDLANDYREKFEYWLKLLPEEKEKAWRTIKAINSYQLCQAIGYVYYWEKMDGIDIKALQLIYQENEYGSYSAILPIMIINVDDQFKIIAFED